MTKAEILMTFNPESDTYYETAEDYLRIVEVYLRFAIECDHVIEALLKLGWDERYSTLSDFLDQHEAELKTMGAMQ